jgi:hypothetical protein
MINKIKNWYCGTPNPVGKVRVGDRLVIVSPQEEYTRSATAKFISVIFDFWLNNWKWIIATIVAIISLYLNFFKK